MTVAGPGYHPPVVEAVPAIPLEFKPHLFGKFFLLQRLAVGGMAEIFRARVPGAGGFEKELVVKRILPARAQDEGFIKMLVNEAKLTVQLTHSNIAQVYECGKIDGNYFISMELVSGVSMKEMMQAFARTGTTISPEQAIFMVLQLLTGLDYAHKKTDGAGAPLQIVHCDVSPDNALISWEGEVKLLDFGIARAATGLSNYKEGMLMGKLGYVAPEQASLERRWDHRVDLFAAGILLYELLTKQKPFPKATDVESLVTARKARRGAAHRHRPAAAEGDRRDRGAGARLRSGAAVRRRAGVRGRAGRRALPHAAVVHPGPARPADAAGLRREDRPPAQRARPRPAHHEGPRQPGREAGPGRVRAALGRGRSRPPPASRRRRRRTPSSRRPGWPPSRRGRPAPRRAPARRRGRGSGPSRRR